jgi:uncharacterized protein YjiS (DUF1127 family)
VAPDMRDSHTATGVFPHGAANVDFIGCIRTAYEVPQPIMLQPTLTSREKSSGGNAFRLYATALGPFQRKQVRMVVMSFSLETSTESPAPKIPSTEVSVWSAIRRIVGRISRQRASLREIENMSNRTLADIGLSRAQFLFEYDRYPSQRPPS